MDDVLAGWRQRNQEILRGLRPGLRDEFCLEQSQVDADKGFCSYPMPLPALQRQLKGDAFRVVPRCVIVQSSGKKRIIDNADAGGQSERSAERNKLVVCSALRPAHHVAAVRAWFPDDAWPSFLATHGFESGGEDWPDAYRHSPISFTESKGCIVVFWRREWQQPAAQIYSSLLFGLPLAVVSFNRYSRLAESLGRRFSMCLPVSFTSMMQISWIFNLVEVQVSKHLKP